jgi:hypothetical protein
MTTQTNLIAGATEPSRSMASLSTWTGASSPRPIFNMADRKSISKRMRFEVFKRDSFTCQYCGAKPPEVPLEIDHIIPVSKDGKNTKNNLITACFDCNRGKSNVELTNIPRPLSEVIERKKIAQSQYSDYKRVLKRERKIVDDQITQIEVIYSNAFEEYVFVDRFKTTVKKFISELGLPCVIDAMELACSKIYYDEQKVLKYFCGICWNRIKENE